VGTPKTYQTTNLPELSQAELRAPLRQYVTSAEIVPMSGEELRRQDESELHAPPRQFIAAAESVPWNQAAIAEVGREISAGYDVRVDENLPLPYDLAGKIWFSPAAPSSETSASPSLSTSEITAQFLASKCNDLAEGSITKYESSLKTFTKQYPCLPMTPEPIESYLAARPASLSKRYLYALLSGLYQFAHDRLNVPNVMERIKRPRKGKSKESDWLTLEQLRVLLSAADDDRLLAMVYVMVGLGFRRSEVCRANVGDIASDKIRVDGKEGVEWLPLLPEIRDQLLKQVSGRIGGQPLFVSKTTGGRLGSESLNKIIRDLFERAGINDIRPSPHTLRHTYCTLMQAAGCDRYSVELLMRHRTTNTTDIYTHTSTEQRLQLLRPKLEQFCLLRLVNGHKPMTGNLL
jgi:integrase